jgi:hypothetical protein
MMVDERKPRMRVERSGPIEPLTPRIVTFLQERLGGVSLDEDGDVEQRPDFACLKGLVAIEIKSLETDPSERLVTALVPEMESGKWPAFYGTWPIESVLKHLPNAEEIKEKLLDRLGRTVVRVIKKANDQLAQHTVRTPRRNLVRLLFLLNEDHPEYDPSTITFVVQRELARKNADGGHRNANVDAVVYLTDRHVAIAGSDIYLPALVIFGPSLEDQPWKIDVVNLILGRWAAWNGVPILPEGTVGLEDSVTVEHVPNSMKRQELWALEYRRRPYMRRWEDTDLRNHWDQTMLLSLLWGHVDTPMRVPPDGVMKVMESFTHVMQEVSTRGLPLDFFRPDSVRLGKAVDGLPYGPGVANWLRQVLSLPSGDHSVTE